MSAPGPSVHKHQYSTHAVTDINLDNVCKNGNTLLWDLVQDDNAVCSLHRRLSEAFRVWIAILMLSLWPDPPIGGLDQWGGEAVVLSGLLVHWPSDPHAFHRGLSGEPRQPPVRPLQSCMKLLKRFGLLSGPVGDIWPLCFCVCSSGRWWCPCVCCRSSLGRSSSSAPAMTLIGLPCKRNVQLIIDRSQRTKVWRGRIKKNFKKIYLKKIIIQMTKTQQNA